MTDRERLEAITKGYIKLMALVKEQNLLEVKLIRDCVVRLQSPNSIKRREAINGLIKLADMMEKNA